MRLRQYLASFVTCFSVFTLIFTFSYLNQVSANVMMLMVTQESMEQHRDIVDKYFSSRNAWRTSNLGAYLFKYYNSRTPPSKVVNKVPERGYYNIQIWNGFGIYWDTSLLGCSVSNCKIEKENSESFLATADAVVVHLPYGTLPDMKTRKPFQRWIFWSDEPPTQTFFMAGKQQPSFNEFAGIFNWSMSYRSDADVSVPYGRTVPLSYPKLNDITDEHLKDLVPYWETKRTDTLIVNIMSHCLSFRLRFIKQLRRYMSVDMLGKCAETENERERCPRHNMKDCPVISEYLFYLVIENSNCRQYISEKIFHHAYSKGAIPVIMGAPLEDCIKLLPPNSFIHMENFVSVKHLASKIQDISDDIERLLSYHAWRNNFEAVEEHGFLGTRSLALCRLCEAMNHNDRSIKVYELDDIRLYLDPVILCSKNRNWL